MWNVLCTVSLVFRYTIHAYAFLFAIFLQTDYYEATILFILKIKKVDLMT